MRAPSFGAALVALAGWTTQIVRANVIGVDLGTDFMKVALVAPRKPLEIVVNTATKRKTEMALNFDRGERNFGGDAYVLLPRMPKQTITKFGSLLGHGLDHPAVQALTEAGLPISVVYNETRGGLNVRLVERGQETFFTPEELVAMMLGHAQEITRIFGYAVKDVVLTTPEYATYLERKALLDAAELAGLVVLDLVDENTAAALQYGIDRAHDEPKNVLFYNMGANSVQVSVVTYGPKMDKGKNVGQATVRGKGWDSTLGGFQFDQRVASIIAEGFNRKWKKGDVKELERPMAKIRSRATKIKEVLSANVEIPVTIESLHDDIDYTTLVTRAQFEEASKELFGRLMDPVHRALEMAGLTLGDIQDVELLGGGVRVPKVQEVLRESFKKGAKQDLDLGMHMNGDEAMALGAAFRGANISRAFAVRQVGLTDITPFAVTVSLRDVEAPESGGFLGGLLGGHKKKEGAASAEEPYSKEAQLYGPGTPLPWKKTFTTSHAKDLEVNLTYSSSNPYLPEGTRPMIASYNVSGVAKFAEEMAKEGHGVPKVSLYFTTDTNGVVSLASAEAAVEYQKEVTYQEVVEDPDAAPEADTADAKTEGAPETPADGNKTVEEGEPEAASEETAGDEAADAAGADGDAGKGKEDKKGAKGGKKGKDAKGKKAAKKKTKTVSKKKMVTDKKKRKLSVEPSFVYMDVRPMTAEEKATAKARLTALHEADNARKAKAHAKNDLEGYILLVRNFLQDKEDEVSAVSTDQQRTEVVSLATTLEEWLYDEGWDEDAATYKKKRAELHKPAEAIFLRLREVKDRPEAVERARKNLQKIVDKVGQWATSKPQVTQEEREELLGKIKLAEEWLDKKEKDQKSKAPHEDAAFTSADVEPQLKTVNLLVSKLSKKQAPKPEVPKKNATEEAASAGNQTEAGGAGTGSEADAEGTTAGDSTDGADPGSPDGVDAAELNDETVGSDEL